MLDNEEQIKRIWDTLDRVGKRLDRVGDKLDQVARDFGGFQNNASECLENEFYDALHECKKIGDAVFVRVYKRLRGEHGEYDLVAVNGGAVYVGEVKQKLLPNEVQKFAENRLPYYAEDFPEMARGRKVFGMVGGENIVDDAVEEAQARGLVVLRLENKKLLAQNAENARAVC